MKKSMKKWKLALIIVIVLSLGGGVVWFGIWNDSRKMPEVYLTGVTRADVNKTYSTSAPAQASSKSIFYCLEGVKVNEVKVAVGKEVKAGDLLATFDVAPLQEEYNRIQQKTIDAKAANSNAIIAAQEAEAQLPVVEAEIKTYEKKVADAAAASGNSTSTTSAPVASDAGGIMEYIGNIFGDSAIGDLVNSLIGAGSSVTQINDIIKGLNSLTGLAGVDISKILGTSMDGFSDQSKLIELQVKKAVYKGQMSADYLQSVKDAALKAENTEKEYYDKLKILSSGWKATEPGIVTEVNITPGKAFTLKKASSSASASLDMSSITSMLQGGGVDQELINTLISMFMNNSSSSDSAPDAGIIIENYDEFLCKISLGKYDFQDVKVGQQVVISSLDNKYSGEVKFIGATATPSSSLDVSNLLTQITGGMGGGSSNAAECIISIKNPDSGITIGFDVDISIITDKAQNALVVPVEAVRLAEGQTFVYTYNSKTKTVSRKNVKTGISDDTKTVILEGLNEGEVVVRSHSGSTTNMYDGVKAKVAETTTASKQ